MRENFPFPNLDNNHESIVNQHIYLTLPLPSPHHVSRKHSTGTITPDIDPAIYEIPLMIRDK